MRDMRIVLFGLLALASVSVQGVTVTKDITYTTAPSVMLENFNGAVGDFRFDLSANPRAVKAGEPITVTMTITGIGNLDTVSLPRIPCGDAFKTYTPEIGVKRGVQGGLVGGVRLEDDVVVTRGGVRVLSTLSTELEDAVV